MEINDLLRPVAEAFPLDAAFDSAQKLGNGHINQTYLVRDAAGGNYVFQRINDGVFQDVDLLMNNIFAVTSYLNQKNPGSSLVFLRTKQGNTYFRSGLGCFRAYRFVEGLCMEKAETPQLFETCGMAFGDFQNALGGFDASLLGETIPRFHDTVKRVADLEQAALSDKCGRLKGVRAEYDFYLERKSEAGKMLDMLAKGELKKRVTHNDTKLNNVILDAETLRPRCVIDLDTVMPGLAGNDFGDCIRSGATTGAEDEQDLSKVSLDTRLYRAFARGFLGACGRELSRREIETLPLGAKLMTYECGARFLTDYLNGDTYFHIAYSEHNLVRCRTQMKLVADTEARWGEVNDIILQEADS